MSNTNWWQVNRSQYCFHESDISIPKSYYQVLFNSAKLHYLWGKSPEYMLEARHLFYWYLHQQDILTDAEFVLVSLSLQVE